MRRERTRRTPLNVGTMGDTRGERALYMAVQNLADESDDALPIWDEAKVEELKSQVLEHYSYPLPPDRKPINSKWMVKAKTQPVRKLKARFTPKGCGQKYNVDYKET